MYVAEAFTGQPGEIVPLERDHRLLQGVCEGKYDHLPEQAFFMVGGIEQAEKKAAELQK